MGQAQSQSMGGDCSDCLTSGEGMNFSLCDFNAFIIIILKIFKIQENTEDLTLLQANLAVQVSTIDLKEIRGPVELLVATSVLEFPEVPIVDRLDQAVVEISDRVLEIQGLGVQDQVTQDFLPEDCSDPAVSPIVIMEVQGLVLREIIDQVVATTQGPASNRDQVEIQDQEVE